MERVINEGTKESIFDRRRRASIRAFLCPGAGFATLGHPCLALLTYAVALGTWTWLIVLCSRPESWVLWLALASAIATLILWLAELGVAHSDRPDLPAVTASSSNWHRVGGLLLAATAVTAVVLIRDTYSIIRLGPEMLPSFPAGKYLVVRHDVDTGKLARDALVYFEPGWPKKDAAASPLYFGRILAVAGDRVSVRDGRYLVNGRAGPPVSSNRPRPVAVEIAAFPDATMVPSDYFFVRQDSNTVGEDSSTLAWISYANVVSTEFFEPTLNDPLRPLSEIAVQQDPQ